MGNILKHYKSIGQVEILVRYYRINLKLKHWKIWQCSNFFNSFLG